MTQLASVVCKKRELDSQLNTNFVEYYSMYSIILLQVYQTSKHILTFVKWAEKEV